MTALGCYFLGVAVGFWLGRRFGYKKGYLKAYDLMRPHVKP